MPVKACRHSLQEIVPYYWLLPVADTFRFTMPWHGASIKLLEQTTLDWGLLHDISGPPNHCVLLLELCISMPFTLAAILWICTWGWIILNTMGLISKWTLMGLCCHTSQSGMLLSDFILMCSWTHFARLKKNVCCKNCVLHNWAYEF